MGGDRPSSDEKLRRGAVTEPRRSASLILLRDRAQGLEVLLLERSHEQRFMPGAWVFPGGATEPGDADARATARRELFEEAGIALADDTELIAFSRWITPAEIERRFDTSFFVALAPAGVAAKVDGDECVDARWIRPADALELARGDALELVFPTIKHLEQLADGTSVVAVLESARARPVEPVQPRLRVIGDVARVFLPGERGYDD